MFLLWESKVSICGSFTVFWNCGLFVVGDVSLWVIQSSNLVEGPEGKLCKDGCNAMNKKQPSNRFPAVLDTYYCMKLDKLHSDQRKNKHVCKAQIRLM